MPIKRRLTILSVAGSDNSSGAGIQADIKTSEALNAYCLTALTAVTSQNSKSFLEYFILPPNLVISQIVSLLDEYKVDAIKIGLIPSLKLANFLFELIFNRLNKIPIVVDPIYKSTTGKTFFEKSQYLSVYKKLAKISTVITPNLYEARLLSRFEKKNNSNIQTLLVPIYELFDTSVLITGGDNDDLYSNDFLLVDNKITVLKSKKKKTKNTHGSGCTFSTALAIHLAKGFSLVESAKRSKKFIIEGIKRAPKFNLAYGPIGH